MTIANGTEVIGGYTFKPNQQRPYENRGQYESRLERQRNPGGTSSRHADRSDDSACDELAKDFAKCVLPCLSLGVSGTCAGASMFTSCSIFADGWGSAITSFFPGLADLNVMGADLGGGLMPTEWNDCSLGLGCFAGGLLISSACSLGGALTAGSDRCGDKHKPLLYNFCCVLHGTNHLVNGCVGLKQAVATGAAIHSPPVILSSASACVGATCIAYSCYSLHKEFRGCCKKEQDSGALNDDDAERLLTNIRETGVITTQPGRSFA